MSVSSADRTLKAFKRVIFLLAIAMVAALLPVAAPSALLPFASRRTPAPRGERCRV